MKIYTKNGDAGRTKTILGTSIAKDSITIELQGTVDEANASIGHLRALIEDHKTIIKSEIDNNGPWNEVGALLRTIQQALFRIGSDISSEFSSISIKEEDIELLEQFIDKVYEVIGKQETFIYYSGNQSATYAQVVRAIVRRSERLCVSMCKDKAYPIDGKYLNRLADLFYAVGRYLNYLDDIKDEPMV